MLWVANIRCRIELLKGNDPARLEEGEHFGQQRVLRGARQVDQHQSLMHDIVSALLQTRVQCISVDDLNIVERAFFNLRSCHVDETRLAFDADYGPPRANTLREQVHDPDWSATDVNGVSALLKSHPIEHPCCLFLEATCLGHEPLLFCERAAKGVRDGEG